MIRNFFKVAIRSLIRHKGYAFINIFGLTAGIAVSSLLFLFVRNELSYDKFNPHHENVYRVIEKLEDTNGTRRIGVTTPSLGPELDALPEVETTASMYRPWGHANLFIGNQRFLERNWCIATSTVIDIFKFEFQEGNPEKAMSEPGIIISKNAALRFFGSESALGKIIKDSQFGDLAVTGVFRNLPSNSHLDLDIILPFANLSPDFSQRLMNWDQYAANMYIRVHQGTNVDQLQRKIEQLAAPHWEDNSSRGDFWLQPLDDIYFGSKDVEYGLEKAKGEKFYVYLIGTVAFFIIILACINYTNLATARSTQRAREIGMRKVNGALRWQLILQFLGESVLLSFIAFLLSIGLTDLLMPPFNELTGKDFSIDILSNNNVMMLLLGTSLAVGLVAGVYPALFMSKLSAGQSLKGELRSGRSGLWLRQGLVVFQFFLSIVMITSTLVMDDQMHFIQTKNLGFQKDNMLVIDINSGSARSSFEAMKKEFSDIPGVEEVACSSRVPGEWKEIVQLEAKAVSVDTDSIPAYFMCFDPDMLSTYHLDLIEGRNFSNNIKLDSLSVLLNETAARQFGLENPLNNEIYLSDGGIVKMKVIGVVKDFNFQSLHEDIRPLIIGFWSNPVTSIDYFSLRLSTNNFQDVIKSAEAVHNKFDLVTSMEYHFLDQQLDQFYKSEERQANVFSLGSVLAIIIACMGLLGLASFIILKRMKEIGIRKMLGASNASLFFHLNRSFLIQILIAFAVAVPVSYFLMIRWLSFFAFRINLSAGIFILSGMITIGVALLAVSYQILSASRSNPADILKIE